MSKLLIDDYPLQLLPKLALAIGLNEAIILQQLQYWIQKYQDIDESHHHDGRWWVYNTREGWQENFPWWSESTVWRTLLNLRDMGLVLVSSKYNKAPYDRTLWYTIDYEALERLEKEKSSGRKTPSSQDDNNEPPNAIPTIPDTTESETSPETTNTGEEEIQPEGDNSSPLRPEQPEEEKENLAWLSAFAGKPPEPPRPPRTREEAIAETRAALDAFHKRTSGMTELEIKIEDFLEGVPVYLHELARTFCREFGRLPLPGERLGWIKAWQAQAQLGLSPTNVEQAMRYMVAPENNLTISWPGSVTAIAEKHKKFGTLGGKKNPDDSQAIFDRFMAGDSSPSGAVIDL